MSAPAASDFRRDIQECAAAIERAFGAPGDYGDAKKSQALADLYFLAEAARPPRETADADADLTLAFGALVFELGRLLAAARGRPDLEDKLLAALGAVRGAVDVVIPAVAALAECIARAPRPA